MQKIANGVLGVNGVHAQSHVMEAIKQEREVKQAMKLMEEFAVVNHQKLESAIQMFVKVIMIKF